jgi:hypothetical protein
MHTVHNDRIPKDKMQQFHETIGSTGSRYLHNPIESKDCFIVSYAPSIEFCQVWNPYLTSVIEVNKNQIWRTFLRRVKFSVSCLFAGKQNYLQW